EPVRQWNRSHPFPVSSTGPTIGEEKAKVKENFEGAVSVFASPPTALGLALFIVGSCRNDLRVLAFDFAELLRSNETDATASGLRQQHPGDLLHGIQVRNAAVVICGTLAHLERNARGRRDSTAEYFLFRHTESTPHNSPFTSDTQRCSFFRSAILYTNGNHRFLFLRSEERFGKALLCRGTGRTQARAPERHAPMWRAATHRGKNLQRLPVENGTSGMERRTPVRCRKWFLPATRQNGLCCGRAA